MTDFHLRDATLADAARLATLHVQTFQETHGGGPSVATRRAQWEQILRGGDPRDFTFVVEGPDRELVGFARGAPHTGSVPGFAGEWRDLRIVAA